MKSFCWQNLRRWKIFFSQSHKWIGYYLPTLKSVKLFLPTRPTMSKFYKWFYKCTHNTLPCAPVDESTSFCCSKETMYCVTERADFQKTGGSGKKIFNRTNWFLVQRVFSITFFKRLVSWNVSRKVQILKTAQGYSNESFAFQSSKMLLNHF